MVSPRHVVTTTKILCASVNANQWYSLLVTARLKFNFDRIILNNLFSFIWSNVMSFQMGYIGLVPFKNWHCKFFPIEDLECGIDNFAISAALGRVELHH